MFLTKVTKLTLIVTDLNDAHDEKVEVGHSPELLKQVLGQEGQNRVLGGRYLVLL